METVPVHPGGRQAGRKAGSGSSVMAGRAGAWRPPPLLVAPARDGMSLLGIMESIRSSKLKLTANNVSQDAWAPIPQQLTNYKGGSEAWQTGPRLALASVKPQTECQ